MLSRLPRCFGVALLVASLATAPVLAATPRCCKTGAIAGGGNCCCQPDAEPAEAEPSQTEAPRPCCAASESEAVDVAEPSPLAFESRCTCQVQTPLPAVPADERSAARNQSVLVAILPACDETAATTVAQARVAAQAEPPPCSLQKIYCRWTV